MVSRRPREKSSRQNLGGGREAQTLEDVTLVAELRDKSTVYGESHMHQDHASPDVDLQGRAPIERVFLAPAHAVG